VRMVRRGGGGGIFGLGGGGGRGKGKKPRKKELQRVYALKIGKKMVSQPFPPPPLIEGMYAKCYEVQHV